MDVLCLCKLDYVVGFHGMFMDCMLILYYDEVLDYFSSLSSSSNPCTDNASVNYMDFISSF